MVGEQTPANGTSGRRARKACTQCRQQKARCDVDVVQPCSRCIKVKADCIISNTFEREHKRRKLYQLQNETDLLRRQLNSRSSTTPKSNGVPGSTSGEDYGIVRDDESSTQRMTDGPIPPDESDEGTQSRTIDGLVLSAAEVDELFKLYFKDYNPVLPILDPSRSPNQYYSDSPQLFWTIIATATRRNQNNPDLIQTIRPKVMDLVLNNIKTPANEYNIEALLIQITWPYPGNLRALDLTFMLDGLMFHMAMQIGLHAPRNLQEFSRVELNLTDEDRIKKTTLWANCLLMHQTVLLLKGTTGIAFEDVTLDPEARRQMLMSLPDYLRFHLQMQDLLRCCCTTVGKIGLQNLSAEQEDSLNTLLIAFEQQLEMLETPKDMAALTELRLLSAKFQIVSFHLYKEPETLARQPAILTKLYAACKRYIDSLRELVANQKCAASAVPLYFQYGLISTSCILLRLVKSPALRNPAYEEQAQSTVQKAVELAKQLSIEPSDLPSRTSIIVGQLLTSNKAFIHPDTLEPGVEPQSVPLRAKGRLTASHVLDTGAWWREEFHGTVAGFPYPMKNFGPTGTILKPIERLNGRTPNSINIKPLTNSQLPSAGDTPVPSEAFTPGAFGEFLGDDLSLDFWGAWPETEGWGIPGLT